MRGEEGGHLFGTQEYGSDRKLYDTNNILFILILYNIVCTNQESNGDDNSRQKIKVKMPRRVKKRRKVQADDGV